MQKQKRVDSNDDRSLSNVNQTNDHLYRFGNFNQKIGCNSVSKYTGSTPEQTSCANSALHSNSIFNIGSRRALFPPIRTASVAGSFNASVKGNQPFSQEHSISGRSREGSISDNHSAFSYIPFLNERNQDEKPQYNPPPMNDRNLQNLTKSTTNWRLQERFSSSKSFH